MSARRSHHCGIRQYKYVCQSVLHGFLDRTVLLLQVRLKSFEVKLNDTSEDVYTIPEVIASSAASK